MSILNVAEAQAAIHSQLTLLPTERVNLRALNGCALAEAIIMERDQPPFDRVTMDGIAINSAAVQRTRRFRIAATQAAGSRALQLADMTDCIEVMTGAMLPLGCDCVIPVERIERSADDAQLAADIEISPWLNVHRRGSDALQGQTLLTPGRVLTATAIAVIASAGYADALVRCSPRIALVSTGDELIEPGQPIHDWQVRRSNAYALQAALQQHGHTRLTDVHLADDLDVLRTRLQALLDNHEMLVLSGGVSMGKFDFVPQVLTELGIRCVFHKVQQRPGKPMWFGVRDDGKSVFALPGNPVSTFMCLHRYVLPALQQLMGVVAAPQEYIALSDAARSHADLTVFAPVKLHIDAHGTTRASVTPTRGSGDFIALLDSQGCVELSPSVTTIAAGTVVPLYRW